MTIYEEQFSSGDFGSLDSGPNSSYSNLSTDSFGSGGGSSSTPADGLQGASSRRLHPNDLPQHVQYPVLGPRFESAIKRRVPGSRPAAPKQPSYWKDESTADEPGPSQGRARSRLRHQEPVNPDPPRDPNFQPPQAPTTAQHARRPVDPPRSRHRWALGNLKKTGMVVLSIACAVTLIFYNGRDLTRSLFVPGRQMSIIDRPTYAILATELIDRHQGFSSLDASLQALFGASEHTSNAAQMAKTVEQSCRSLLVRLDQTLCPLARAIHENSKSARHDSLQLQGKIKTITDAAREASRCYSELYGTGHEYSVAVAQALAPASEKLTRFNSKAHAVPMIWEWAFDRQDLTAFIRTRKLVQRGDTLTKELEEIREHNRQSFDKLVAFHDSVRDLDHIDPAKAPGYLRERFEKVLRAVDPSATRAFWRACNS